MLKGIKTGVNEKRFTNHHPHSFESSLLSLLMVSPLNDSVSEVSGAIVYFIIVNNLV